MADGLKMLIAMAVFFGAMYLYAWMPDILEARREKKKEKQKEKKEQDREIQKIELQKQRDDITKGVKDRRARIREHYKWLEDMNKKIQETAQR